MLNIRVSKEERKARINGDMYAKYYALELCYMYSNESK